MQQLKSSRLNLFMIKIAKGVKPSHAQACLIIHVPQLPLISGRQQGIGPILMAPDHKHYIFQDVSFLFSQAHRS